MSMIGDDVEQSADTTEYVTALVGDQLFGLPIWQVQDVFVPDRLTRVPLASAEVAGVLNLRGRIVTAIDMRVRLGLPPHEGETTRMAVGIDYAGEAYGLLIDRVGEVMKLANHAIEAVPANLDPRWARMAQGVFRLDGQLLVVLDVNEVLAPGRETIAA